MRRRNTLVESTQAAAFTDMEFVLLRCPKFFAKENLATVFPEAANVAAALASITDASAPSDSAEHEANYYLLYTFQPCDFVMEKTSDNDSDYQGLSSCDEPSSLSTAASPVSPSSTTTTTTAIQKTENESVKTASPKPPVMEWRDRSRDRVYKFMAIAKERIHEYLQATAASTASSSSSQVASSGTAVFFMDWPDPATGLPACSERGATTFSDADTVEQFFPFKKIMVAGPGGGCYMVEHPRFGLNVYLDAAVLVVPHSMEEKLCDAVRSLGAP